MPASQGGERTPFMSTWYGRALIACGLAFFPYGYALLWTTPSRREEPGVTAPQED
jgi:hypothetical protein